MSTTPAPVRARTGISLFFFTNGAMMAGILPRYPEVKAAFELSNTEFGLMVAIGPLASMLASALPAMFPTHIRYSALAAAFNISVLIAGLTPTLAASLVESTQNLMMPAYYLMVIAVIGLITGITMKETANRPLKGATPAASDIQEAKEILREHYDNVEQKIEDIDAEIEELQKKRSRLVDQHPRINE